MFMNIGEFARRIGVSQQTLRVWHKNGTLLPDHVTDGGHRIYSEEQAIEYLGRQIQPVDQPVVQLTGTELKAVIDGYKTMLGYLEALYEKAFVQGKIVNR